MTVDTRSLAVTDATMTGLLNWHGSLRPDAVAVVCGEHQVTFGQLRDRATRLACALMDAGHGAGDRVAILMGNRAEYIEIYLALAAAGMVAVPINTRLTVGEVDYILRDSGASCLLYDQARAAVVHASEVVSAGQIRTLVTLDPAASPAQGGLDSRAYEHLLAQASADPSRLGAAGDEWFYLGYTSGTTGFPKGCVQLQDRMLNLCKRVMLVYGLSADDTSLIPTPMFHMAPTVFSLAQLLIGGAVLLLPEFSVQAMLEAIDQRAPSKIGFAVPPMLQWIIDDDRRDEYDVRSIAGIVVGGAPLHQRTLAGTLSYFPNARVQEFYGATELGLITDICHNDAPGKSASVGPPVLGVSVLIVDEHGDPVADGQIGEIYVSPVMFAGYHGKPDETAAKTLTFDGVSWFSVGDVGYLDDDGYLHITDRLADMIISGGENVYPVEVETVLHEVPGIADVAVIGVPDEEWGEAIHAVVVPQPGAEVDLDDLRAACRSALAGYKIPRSMSVVESIPRNPSGKILKQQLRGDIASGG